MSIILPAHDHEKNTDVIELKMSKQRYVKVLPDFIFIIAKQKVVREVFIYVIRHTLNFPVRNLER